MGRALPPGTLYKTERLRARSPMESGYRSRVMAPFKADRGRDWPSTGSTPVLRPRMDRFLRKPR